MTLQAVQIPGYVAGTWTIDTAHSEVSFLVRHLMITKIRGRFTAFTGQLVLAEDPLESTVTATVDATSVDTANAQRDEHLRSGDFFATDQHPQWAFRSTGLRPAGDAYKLDGEFTIRGITQAVTLDLEINGFGADYYQADPSQGHRAGFTATGEIRRSDFGVSYGGPLPDGVVGLGDKVQITLEIQASAPAAS